MDQAAHELFETEKKAVQVFKSALDEVATYKDEITLVFLTNIRVGSIQQLDNSGIDNSAQYYTESQAAIIVGSFQDSGFHVLTYFSEADFMKDVLSNEIFRKCRRIPVVFSAAEGGSGPGRRALIPAFCRLNGLAYCNSSPHGCSVARHKFHANAILKSVGLPVPEAWMLRTDGRWVGNKQPPAGTKVIVKPMYESMAIGVDDSSVLIVDTDFNEFARTRADEFGQAVTAQQFVTGHEIGVPILDLGKPTGLPIVTYTYEGQARYGARPRTFHDQNQSWKVGLKYLEEYSASQYERFQDLAVTAFEALDMAGMGRIDMRIDEDGRPWIFDTNESPPPLATSAYAFAMNKLGFSLSDMLSLWVASGIRRSPNYGAT